MKCKNTCIMAIPEEESEQWVETLFEEIMTKSFPNWMKETLKQVQESQRVPNKLDPKRPIPRHIIIKITRFKDTISMLGNG